MPKRFVPALLACALFITSGCDTVRPYVKSTKRFYKDWVNVDPSIDIGDPGISDPSLRKLAALFTPVDERLEFMLRALSARDLPPDRDWAQAFLDSFPWLSAVTVLTESGTVVSRMAPYSIKPVDYEPLMGLEKLYKARKLGGAVVIGELGAEVMVAKPLFVDNEYKGLLVAQFDPGSLAKFSPEPGQLIMVAPGAVLWSGDDTGAAQSLAQLNWKSILKSNVSGEQRIGSVRYFWQARYVGQERIVYAVAEAPKPVKVAKEQAQPAPAAVESQPEPQSGPVQTP